MLTQQPVQRYSDRDLKWFLRHLKLAREVSTWSKDPSTQTGAVVTTPGYELVSVGYNGFPRGVADDEDRYNNRPVKYELIVHCEVNAMVSAERPIYGCTLFTWPFASCCRCAGVAVQFGIKRAVCPELPEHLKERWQDSLNYTSLIFQEAGVELIEIPWDVIGVDPKALL